MHWDYDAKIYTNSFGMLLVHERKTWHLDYYYNIGFSISSLYVPDCRFHMGYKG